MRHKVETKIASRKEGSLVLRVRAMALGVPFRPGGRARTDEGGAFYRIFYNYRIFYKILQNFPPLIASHRTYLQHNLANLSLITSHWS